MSNNWIKPKQITICANCKFCRCVDWCHKCISSGERDVINGDYKYEYCTAKNDGNCPDFQKASFWRRLWYRLTKN